MRKVSHREYFTGFYYGDQKQDSMNFRESSYIRDYEVVGMILGYDAINKCITVKQKNKFAGGDVCEILESEKKSVKLKIDKMYDENFNEILAAPHAEMIFKIKYDKYVGSLSFLRREKGV